MPSESVSKIKEEIRQVLYEWGADNPEVIIQMKDGKPEISYRHNGLPSAYGLALTFGQGRIQHLQNRLKFVYLEE